MEADVTRAEAAARTQKKKRRGRVIGWVLTLGILGTLAVGAILLTRRLNAASESASELSYRADMVTQGEISSVISGSGTLSAIRSSTVTAPSAAVVSEVFKQSGDSAAQGETILTIQSDSLDEQLADLNEQLSSLRADIASTNQKASSLNVTAPAAGRVKRLLAAEGDLAEEMEYLCLISTDGRLRITLDAPGGLAKYDTVSVHIGDSAEPGMVTEVSGQTAVIVIENNVYDLDTQAQVYSEDGVLLGSGLLEINEYVTVTAAAGRIQSVSVTENQRVSKGKALFRLKAGAPSQDYLDYKDQEQKLLDEISDLEDQLTVTAPWDCLITSLPVEAGDEAAAGATLCILSGTDGYTMSLSIDELDIASLKQGQDVTVTLDALEGEYAGTVSDISYSGSGSYVTSYTAAVRTGPIQGAYPGMSASVEIITATSGLTTVAPVSAVQYDGSNAYIYLAGSDVAQGSSVPASQLDLDALTKASVTTGMSDGSYIVVSGDLQAGDLIWAPQLTTSSVYTADEDTVSSFTMGGGMPSGGFSGGMPSGGFSGEMPSGGFSGEMPSGGSSRQRPSN